MKIVQSFWTRPILSKVDGDRLSGGWGSDRFHYMSWALSSLSLRKHHGAIKLVTDRKGKELLIDRLRLPYDEVSIVLDDLDRYHHDLWALGKLYTYGAQTEPFIHVDSDVYVWNKLFFEEKHPLLVAQSRELNLHFYHGIISEILQQRFFVPDCILHERKVTNDVHSLNAGVLGGHDLAFFKEYAALAFQFVDANAKLLHKINVPAFNIIFEQYLFYCLAKQRDKRVSYLFDWIDHGKISQFQFWKVPVRNQYIHLVSDSKRKTVHADKMATRLRMQFPEYYYRIMEIENNGIWT